jgi:hypothetical protein
MPSVNQFFGVLTSKLAPSAWIQKRGSIDRAIRSSSMFGPQINTQSFQSFQHSQNPILHNQLKNMDK